MIKRRLPIIATVLTAILVAAFLVWALNRYEAQKADNLVAEADELVDTAIEPRLAHIEGLLSQATLQSQARQHEAEKTSLEQALTAIDEVTPLIVQAREKLDEAAGMRVGETRRQYLQARSRALTAIEGLEKIRREVAVTLYEDPAFTRPETLERVRELEARESEQYRELQAAEQEANSLAGGGSAQGEGQD